jgi:hypothetical protein
MNERTIDYSQPKLQPAIFLTSWIFVRLLGLVYFFAFLSAFVQMKGLLGLHGILPAHDLLEAVKSQTGIERYWLFPTVAWLNSSDLFLQGICFAGCLAALMVMAGRCSPFGHCFRVLSFASL